MSKRRAEAVREETRKQSHRRQRDAEANRRVYIGLIIVGVVLLGLIGAGVIQELVLKPRQPVAEVDGARIAVKDYAKRVLFDWNQSGTAVTDPQGSSLEVLDKMIDEQLLRQQAQQRGIVVSPEEVDEAIEKAFGYLRTPPTATPTPEISPTPLPTPTPGGEPTATPAPTATPVSLESYQATFKTYLSRIDSTSKMTEADFRTLVESDLLRQKLYDAITADVPTTSEQVHAIHILVSIREPYPTPTPVPTGQTAPTPDPSATPTPEPRDATQALARIIEVKQRLDAGEDFAALAAEYSDDTGSAIQGGDLGWFGRGMMVTEFEDAVFALQPGQVSEPVQTDYGYHLIKLIERDPARAMDAYSLQQAQYDAFTTWLTSVQTAAKIDRYWTLDDVPPTPSAAAAG